MSKLRVVSPVNEAGGATTTRGTKVYVNDVEVTEVKAIEITWGVDAAIIATI